MPSFDIVSIIQMHEVSNAVEQVKREIGTRYDFRGSKSTVELKEKESEIAIHSEDKLKLASIEDILKQKLAKRSVSLRSVTFEEPVPAGGDTIRQTVKVKQGLTDEELKKINKLIKDSKLKVNSQIQGDQLRVMGKKRDDLQEIIAHLKGVVKDIELQYVNFRD